MTHSNKVAYDEAGYIFFDASKKINFLEEQKETKSFLMKLKCFTFC